MATEETTRLSEPHAPREASIEAFCEFAPSLKHLILQERHQTAAHDLPYFAAVSDLSDHELTSFTEKDWVLVRTAPVAYGMILFGKLRIPAKPDCYIHFRCHEGEPNTDEKATVHMIQTNRDEQPDGTFKYKAIFSLEDPLEWFDD